MPLLRKDGLESAKGCDIPAFMRIFIFIAVLVIPAALRAENFLEMEDGLKVELANGTVSLNSRGKTIWSKSIVPNPGADAEATLTKTLLADDYQAVLAELKTAKGEAFQAVLLLKKGRSDIKVIWTERVDLRGDPGERSADAVRFQDLTGDGLPEIVTGKISESHRLCGVKKLPLLFRKVFDLEKGKFRPVLAKRPMLNPAADITGLISNDAPITPLIDQVSASAASRSAGDKGDLLFLVKPKAAADKDPSTVWTPGIGNGAGEFATFNVASDVYGVTRIGIRPLPEATKKIRYDRPKTLLLSTGENVYRLVFEEDPAQKPDEVVWFTLPEPNNTSCFSLAVETTFDEASKLPVGLAEVSVLTRLDEPDGLLRLAEDLNEPKQRRQAAMLLIKTGAKAEAPVRKVWKTLNPPGRRLAAEVLSRACAESAADLLVKTAVGSDELARTAALEGLKAASQKAVAFLEKYLEAKDDKLFERAADVLFALGTKDALYALASRLGDTKRNRRKLLMNLISKSSVDTPQKAQDLWDLVLDAESKNEPERLSALLQIASSAPSLQDNVFDKAGPLYDSAADFACRYRLLKVLGKVSCGRSTERLIAAASDPDLQIRAAALRGIGGCADEELASSTLQKGLSDEEPAVRLAALDALYEGRRRGSSSPLERISDIARNDPWPKVRARAVRLSGLFPRDKVMALLKVAAEDASSDVRETALFAVFQYFGKEADALIEARLVAENETDKIKSAAAAAVGRRCQESALPALFALLKRGAEPMAAPSAVEVAVVAARAMGEIGTPEAVSMLKKAAKRSNLSTDRAIEAALKNPGAACGRLAKKTQPDKVEQNGSTDAPTQEKTQ